jgi:hypothetical protein
MTDLQMLGKYLEAELIACRISASKMGFYTSAAEYAGDDILKTAQICAVANTFVGLISPRSYREGMDFTKAVDILQGDVDHQFSRGVVAALVSHLENKGGREAWEHFRVLDEDSEAGSDT